MTGLVRRLYPILGQLVGLAGLGIDAWMIFPAMMNPGPGGADPRSLLATFVYFWTYLTHLTNLGLVLVYLAELTDWPWLGWFRRARTQALIAGFIALVMVFYHFMLAPYIQMQGALAVATYLLHYVAPLLYLVWWLWLARHGGLRWRDLPWMLVPGLAYVAWVLVRGLWAAEYPYDILNPDKLGYAGVAMGVGVIFVAVALFCALLILIDRLLGRRRAS